MSGDVFLDVTQFIEMFQAGYATLHESVPFINGLNVFPVPDGDTGTNMDLSLLSGIRAMQPLADSNFHAVTDALATGLLMGARGNSGVILSQLLRGFTRVSYGDRGLDVMLFAQALQEGVDIAYRAVAKPVEGTILTVAREASVQGRKKARASLPIADWLQDVVTAARSTLDRTPDMLPVLRQAGVVDSGGQGLVMLFEGWLNWLRGDNVIPASQTSLPSAAEVSDLLKAATHESSGEMTNFGYCTEVLLRAGSGRSATTADRLRRKLSAYGDSLLVVSAGDLVKVHVHTLHPGRVLEDAQSDGPLIKIKIDNMTEQFERIHGEEASTDSKSLDGTAQVATALVAVAVGVGIEETLRSLGVHKVVSGGQTMNPSTEELSQAAQEAFAESGAASVIILPNNKNVQMAAEQAAQLFNGKVVVVKTQDIMEGMAAALAFHSDRDVQVNVGSMQNAADTTISGAVVQAARDTVYQDVAVAAGQYLAFVQGELKQACDTRVCAFRAVVQELWRADAELLTILYGESVATEELEQIRGVLTDFPGLDVEFQYGGQPIYDYLISLE